jgi:hypothetical protein
LGSGTANAVRPWAYILESMPTSRYSAEYPPPKMVAAIRARLAKVCSDWPPQLFEAMTARAAWIEFKYERALTEGFRERLEGKKAG